MALNQFAEFIRGTMVKMEWSSSQTGQLDCRIVAVLLLFPATPKIQHLFAHGEVY